MVARYITGIGTGIETSTVPTYQSELCEAEKRGRLVSSEPLFVGVGIEIAYWFDYGMNFKGGAIAWRLPIAFQIVFALVRTSAHTVVVSAADKGLIGCRVACIWTSGIAAIPICTWSIRRGPSGLM